MRIGGSEGVVDGRAHTVLASSNSALVRFSSSTSISFLPFSAMSLCFRDSANSARILVSEASMSDFFKRRPAESMRACVWASSSRVARRRRAASSS